MCLLGQCDHDYLIIIRLELVTVELTCLVLHHLCLHCNMDRKHKVLKQGN